MTSLMLLAILAVFIVCAYGLNRERNRLNKEQKAKLIDAQSSPTYLLAMGLIIGGFLILPYLPIALGNAFILWLIYSAMIGAWALTRFYTELKKLRFPVAYLRIVIVYSFIMVFLAAAFLFVAGLAGIYNGNISAFPGLN